METPLEKHTKALTADALHTALFQDGFPVTYHDCELIAKITEDVCTGDGFYTMGEMADDKGHVVTAYDSKGFVKANFVINRPEISPQRKIPTLRYIRNRFTIIGYLPNDPIIRETHRQIERHIRDGGTWELFSGLGSVSIELSNRNKVKSRVTHYSESN